MNSNIDFQPIWSSAPGETILDILNEKKISLEEFTKRAGFTSRFTNGLVKGLEPITPTIASELELILGGSRTFWINRETQYQEDILRIQKEALDKKTWMEKFPLKDMITFGWIKPSFNLLEKESACFQFFNVETIAEWHEKYDNLIAITAFRTSNSFESQTESVVSWIRQGEIESNLINCNPWNPQALHQTLTAIRKITFIKDPEIFIPKLQELCSKCGVAVVIVPAPTGCRASGATLFIKSNKALLIQSSRYLSDDHFWFSFFHEIGHLLLHGTGNIFLDGVNENLTKEEEEANNFAGEILIPKEYQNELRTLTAYRWEKIIRFAEKVGIAPGIVVGQLQKLGIIKYNQLNSLKRKYKWISKSK